MIRLKDKQFKVYLSEREIADRIAGLGLALSAAYADKKPLLLGILNGSFIFAADLFRKLDIEAEICFIKLASYDGTSSTGEVKTTIGLTDDLRDRHVIVVEDIIDTGRTLSHLLPQLADQGAASVKLVTLLSKPDARKVALEADYTGFVIPDKFVVGYGLDYDGLGRNLPAIYVVEEEGG
jgi:hypoxanthine phosphoribosyltransferase